jgi:hypothetical protein
VLALGAMTFLDQTLKERRQVLEAVLSNPPGGLRLDLQGEGRTPAIRVDRFRHVVRRAAVWARTGACSAMAKAPPLAAARPAKGRGAEDRAR